MMAIMLVATVLGVGLAVLFILFHDIFSWLPISETGSAALDSLVKSAFEGILKLAIIIAYMAAVSRIKDIKRTFQYHGAEHKTIFCYEHGKELTVENIRGERKFHPRCGTSFIVLMMLVGILISFFIDPLFIILIGEIPPRIIRVIIKFLTIPLIMGIGYELLKFAGKHDNLLTRIISAPGMWLQRITVLEPTDDMIECSIAAFTEVIPEDNSDIK